MFIFFRFARDPTHTFLRMHVARCNCANPSGMGIPGIYGYGLDAARAVHSLRGREFANRSFAKRRTCEIWATGRRTCTHVARYTFLVIRRRARSANAKGDRVRIRNGSSARRSPSDSFDVSNLTDSLGTAVRNEVRSREIFFRNFRGGNAETRRIEKRSDTDTVCPVAKGRTSARGASIRAKVRLGETSLLRLAL